MLKSAGFSLEEIANMTYPSQIRLYLESIHKKNNVDFINMVIGTRIGYHADEKSFKKITSDIQKRTK